MLKKIMGIWTWATEPSESHVLGELRYHIDFAHNLLALSAKKTDLERQLAAARTCASKNGCLALLAFGLIAVEILGVTIYFLPK